MNQIAFEIIYRDKDVFKNLFYCKIWQIYIKMYAHYFFNFLVCVRVEPVTNVAIVSGAQQRDSATHIYVPILPQAAHPSRLPRSTEQSSVCCAVGPSWLSILK